MDGWHPSLSKILFLQAIASHQLAQVT